MGFDKGSCTVAFFELNGKWPEDALERFVAKKAGTLDSVKEEPQIGWVSGRYLLETNLDESTVYCGGCWNLTLRRAVRKIPTSLLNAICRREEMVRMKADHLDFLSSKIKREIKAEVQEQHLMKMPPALSGINMVYDPAAKMLYLSCTSGKQIEDFIGFFFQTMDLEPLQITPGLWLSRDFGKLETDVPVLQLVEGGNLENGAAAAAEDMTLGRDFLTYLWYLSESGESKLEHQQYGEFDLMIEGPMTFAATAEAKGAGETSVKKGDQPQQSAEVKAALEVGKKLRKAKLTLTRGDDIWKGTFDADKFVFSSLNLPEGEEMENESRFAERMQNLYVFYEAMNFYFKKFAEAMLKDSAATQKLLQSWVADRDTL